MNQQSEHLSNAQIEKYGIQASGAGPETEEWVEQHLADCPVCRSRVLEFQRTQLGLLPDPKVNKAPTSDCPSEEDLRNLAAGLCSDPIAQTVKSHAAACTYCGPLLQEYTEDFSDNLTAEEQAFLDQLSSASPRLQEQRAREMLKQASVVPTTAGQDQVDVPRSTTSPDQQGVFRTTASKEAAAPSSDQRTSAPESSAAPVSPARLPAKPPPRRFSWKWALIPATAAACALIAFGIWYTQRDTPEKVEKLLAQAYTEQRTIEMRVGNAQYSDVHVERGSNSSRLSRPTPLLEAEAIISRTFSRHSADPKLYSLRGRAEILEWNYDSAIETLRRGLELEPSSNALKTDLASAYFERAEATGKPIDYGKSVELLGEVLSANPRDPVALFNHAIACERIFLYRQALDDWQHYLEIESSGQWSNEARQRLSEIKKKLDEHQRGAAARLLSPGEFLQRISERDSSTWFQVNDRVEEYIDVAFRTWLPQATARAGPAEPEASLEARKALSILASILQKSHSDNLLQEMLSIHRSRQWSNAVSYLGHAIEDNSIGQFDAAQRNAIRAAHLFTVAGSYAGYVRAELEEIYAWHRMSEGQRCLTDIHALERSGHFLSYRWAYAQLMLEKAVCLYIVEDLQASEQALDVAIAATNRSQYRTLHLRALSFAAADMWALQSRASEAWLRGEQGLASFWQGIFPPIRAYTFYEELTLPAERAGDLQLVYFLRKEALSEDELMHDEPHHVMARLLFAKAASQSGRMVEAKSEFNTIKNALWKESYQSAPLSYRVFCRIELAKLALATEDFDSGLKLLSEEKSHIGQLQNSSLQLEFHLISGELLAKQNQLGAAEDAFWLVLTEAEKGRNSLKNPAERLSWARNVDAAYRGLVGLKWEQRKAEEAFRIWHLYRSASSNKRDFLKQSINLPPTQSDDLPDLSTNTLLVYVMLPNGLAIWAYDDRGIVSKFVHIKSSDLAATARTFRAQCSDPGSPISALKGASAPLYQWMIKPVDGFLSPERTLIIIPDSLLNEIPIEAIATPTGDFMGLKYSIVSSPLFPKHQSLARFSRSISALVLAPSNSVATSDLGLLPLPDAQQEASFVAQEFQQATLLKGPEADLNNFKRFLPSKAVLHFVGHAILVRGDAALLLSNSGSGGSEWLTTKDLRAAVSDSLRLVVLSACSTGRLGETDDSELNTLTGSLIAAGVPHVVATRWNIDSTVTKTLMREFYRQLLKGARVSQALLLARRDIASQISTQNPYYWAGFVAFGQN